jgi:hypothetical protein
MAPQHSIAVSCNGPVNAACVVSQQAGHTVVTIVVELQFSYDASGSLEVEPPAGPPSATPTTRADCHIILARNDRITLRRGDETLLDGSEGSEHHCNYLQGGERLTLHSSGTDLRLPRFRPQVWVEEAVRQAVVMQCDGMFIDGEACRGCLSFRGRALVTDVSRVGVEVTLDTLDSGDEPEALVALDATVALQSASPFARRPPVSDALNQTMSLDDAAMSPSVLPFAGISPPPAALASTQDQLDFSGTVLLAPESVPSPALPFESDRPVDSSRPIEADQAAAYRAAADKAAADKAAAARAAADKAAAARAAAAKAAADKAAAARAAADEAAADKAAADKAAAARREADAAKFAAEQEAAKREAEQRQAMHDEKKRKRAVEMRSALYDFKKKRS